MIRGVMLILITVVANGDCWNPIVINSTRHYDIANEGELFIPLCSENGMAIKANLIIDSDLKNMVRMGTSFSLGDTIVIDFFEPSESYTHNLSVHILNGRYFFRYYREINFTEFVQTFECTKGRLELNSSNLSNDSKIRGFLEYSGKCVSGCIDKNKRVRIAGNFAVTIRKYSQ